MPAKAPKWLAALVVMPAAAASAQDEQRLSTQIRVNTAFHDNFFQASDEHGRRQVWSRTVSGRVTRRLQQERPLRLSWGVEHVTYDEIGSSPGLTGGIRMAGGAGTLSLSAAYAWDRPRFDVGDTFERADVIGFTAVYGRRLPLGLEAIGSGEFRREFYRFVRLRDSDAYEVAGAVRWRGLGRLFSPEFGTTTGRRTTGSPNENYDETEIYSRLRSAPLPALYLSLRYRHRLRGYSTTDDAARNFARRDRRRGITASVDVSLMTRLALNCITRARTLDRAGPAGAS
jgi:hypothetical protein